MNDLDVFQRFGDVVRAIRDQQRLSQRALARLLQVSPGYVGQWESGISKPSCDIIHKICILFDINDEEYLLKLAFAETAPAYVKESLLQITTYCEDGKTQETLSSCEAEIVNLVRRLPPEHVPLITQKLQEWVHAYEHHHNKRKTT